jgi:hypothetical protein
MTSQLAWVERHGVGRNRRAREMRMEAAALRADIQEAEFLIDRLGRRYLNGDEHNSIQLDDSPLAMGDRQAR